MNPKIITPAEPIPKVSVATAHYTDDAILLAVAPLQPGAVLKIDVPTSLERRRVWSIFHSSNSPAISFEGETIFYNAGAPVLRLPFNFGVNNGRRFDAADTTSAPDGGVSGPDKLWINADGIEWPNWPLHLNLACNRIELFIRRMNLGIALAAFCLACLSEGKEPLG
jgi:hypothetical protein